MGNHDDWVADDGGFDFEEFQEDASFAADMAGMQQRRRQIEELGAVRELLSRQEAERDRVANLPKCPECNTPLDGRPRICAACRSSIIWLSSASAFPMPPQQKPYSTARFPETLVAMYRRYGDSLSSWKHTAEGGLSRLRSDTSAFQADMERQYSSVAAGRDHYRMLTTSRTQAKARLARQAEEQKHKDPVGSGCLWILGLLCVGVVAAVATIGRINDAFGQFSDMSSMALWAIVLGPAALYILVTIIARATSGQAARTESLHRDISECDHSPLVKRIESLNQQWRAICDANDVHRTIEQELVRAVDTGLENRVKVPSQILQFRQHRTAEHQHSRKWPAYTPFDPSFSDTLREVARTVGVSYSSGRPAASASAPPPPNEAIPTANRSGSPKRKPRPRQTGEPSAVRRFWVKRRQAEGVREKILGPYSRAQMRKLIDSGRIHDDDRISESEGGPWKKIRGN